MSLHSLRLSSNHRRLALYRPGLSTTRRAVMQTPMVKADGYQWLRIRLPPGGTALGPPTHFQFVLKDAGLGAWYEDAERASYTVPLPAPASLMPPLPPPPLPSVPAQEAESTPKQQVRSHCIRGSFSTQPGALLRAIPGATLETPVDCTVAAAPYYAQSLSDV